MGSNLQVKRVTTFKANRRQVAGALLGAAAGATVARGAHAQATPISSPQATPVTPVTGQHLLVADRTQSALYVYAIPQFTLAGTVEGIGFGTHGGTLQLADGRCLFADTANNAIVALTIDQTGTPEISQGAPARLGGGVAWIAASPTFSHLAVGSLLDDEATQFLNIVNLETFENAAIEFTMNEPEEITAWLLGDPLHVHVAVGGQVNSYLLDDLAAGNTDPIGAVQVELGSHGGATDATTDRIFYTTAPDTGFEVLNVANGGAEYLTQIPWDVDGLSGGRNARPRVTADGQHIFGLMTPELDDPTQWAETMVSIHVTDTAGLAAVRLPIDTGNFGYRWGLSDRYALWAGYNANGGTVYLIDADATSPAFGTVVATMPIDLPTRAAAPGEDFEGTDTYATAITADSRYGFVSINGDRRVKVFDLERLEEIAEFAIEIPLSGYDGYITVIEPGVTPADIWAR